MIKTELHRRFWLIELLGYWEGRITSLNLPSFFQLGHQQASKDINQYLRLYPDKLPYFASAKGYLPTAQYPSESIYFRRYGHVPARSPRRIIVPTTLDKSDDINPWLFCLAPTTLSREATGSYAQCWWERGEWMKNRKKEQVA
ncbi:hypothetical protein HNR62_000053 [Oceanisphaera litoralis]|uniref:hypothetical protein n=1 Tax=Oceanisphaera litoralis TaxID=225144 RepID=UPI00195ABD94|nr:hypothetical protein [Oceanisphaera litoralis]MBM7454229.1 hypothetical protein [Oceanisphaera litoralis]